MDFDKIVQSRMMDSLRGKAYKQPTQLPAAVALLIGITIGLLIAKIAKLHITNNNER